MDQPTPNIDGLTAPEFTRFTRSMVVVAHDPHRFSDDELTEAMAVWTELLTNAPDLHLSAPEFFAFHQGLIDETEARVLCDGEVLDQRRAA